jgi:hypothetical protein
MPLPVVLGYDPLSPGVQSGDEGLGGCILCEFETTVLGESDCMVYSC